MGVYELSKEKAREHPRSEDESQGAPLYTKRRIAPGLSTVKDDSGGDEHHYLYRWSQDGRWRVVDSKSKFSLGNESANRHGGCFISTRASDLPSGNGLNWQHGDSGVATYDPNVACIEVSFFFISLYLTLTLTLTLTFLFYLTPLS